jgi:hypothetical protein
VSVRGRRKSPQFNFADDGVCAWSERLEAGHNGYMPASLVLRAIYIDASVDHALTAQARAQGVSKGAVFRRWLGDGVRAVRQGRRARVAMPAATTPLLLKTVQLSSRVDHLLRVQAFDERLQQNEVLRQYLAIGVELNQGS